MAAIPSCAVSRILLVLSTAGALLTGVRSSPRFYLVETLDDRAADTANISNYAVKNSYGQDYLILPTGDLEGKNVVREPSNEGNTNEGNTDKGNMDGRTMDGGNSGDGGPCSFGGVEMPPGKEVDCPEEVQQMLMKKSGTSMKLDVCVCTPRPDGRGASLAGTTRGVRGNNNNYGMNNNRNLGSPGTRNEGLSNRNQFSDQEGEDGKDQGSACTFGDITMPPGKVMDCPQVAQDSVGITATKCSCSMKNRVMTIVPERE